MNKPREWESCGVCGGQGWYDVDSNNEYGIEARQCHSCKGRGGRFLTKADLKLKAEVERDMASCFREEAK